MHANLLERSTRPNAVWGGGTMTALPIVEPRQGEIAAYIPTNLISITHGRVYLDNRLSTRVSGRPLTSVDRSRASASAPNIPASRQRRDA